MLQGEPLRHLGVRSSNITSDFLRRAPYFSFISPAEGALSDDEPQPIVFAILKYPRYIISIQDFG